MFELSGFMIYIFLFISLYFEVFLLLTFFENRNEIRAEKAHPADFPSATIIVPCFNEEESIFGTVDSLLALDYPKGKLKIMIVDDGSTDNSWNLIQKYKNHPLIEIFKKENGGKHTALNFAIEKSESDIIGCLDADSFVNPDALKNIAAYFTDQKIMAVIPAIKIYQPNNILQKIQKVEYDWGIFLRKMLSFVDALYVTPGCFSFYRKEVFENLGPYHLAHNSEDMEIAMRMQKNGYKIKNCHTAFVHTIAPDKFSKLFTQRLRWSYGFLKNVIDYRELFFNKTQGNLGFFVLPVMMVSAVSTLWLAGLFIFNIISEIITWFMNWQAINFNWHSFNIFDHNLGWFYLNTNIITFITIFSIALIITLTLLGRKISEGKIRFKIELLYFLMIYPFIYPTWLAKSVYNVLISKKTTWR